MSAAMAPVVALVGMRGAGKTTLGRNGAELLGFGFKDLDEVIADAAGCLPPQIVAERGWPGFRSLEAKCFRSTAEAAEARIVACGGGIIETSEGLELLRAHHPVIFIDRHIDDVVATLEGDTGAQAHRASLGEHPRETYKRRRPFYVQAADFRFPIVRGESDLKSLSHAFARLVHGVLGQAVPALVSDSFFISLTAPDYEAVATREAVALAAAEADCLELRVDLLKSLEADDVVRQVALLRRAAPETPLLYTVRSVEHGGRFAGSEQQYVELNLLGLQLGAELLDVECTWSDAGIDKLVGKKGATLLVGSYHNFDRMLSKDELREVFQTCRLKGLAAIAKVVVKAECREDNWLVQDVGKATCAPGAFIGLCLGAAGKLSRVLNEVMCPSMHPSLAPGAPGQMSVPDLLTTRTSLGLLGRSRAFYVLAPLHSKRAAWYVGLLGAVFQALRLPHAAARGVAPQLLLRSTGGAVALDTTAERLALEPWADVSYVDCVAKRDDELFGHCCKAERLQALLSTTARRCCLLLGHKSAALSGLRSFQKVEQEVEKASDVDAVVCVEPLGEPVEGLRGLLMTWKPMVVDASSQPHPELERLAQQCGCEFVGSKSFLVDEVRAWLSAWHIEASREALAEVVEAFSAAWPGKRAWEA